MNPKKKKLYAGFYITIFIWMSQYKYSKNKNKITYIQQKKFEREREVEKNIFNFI